MSGRTRRITRTRSRRRSRVGCSMPSSYPRVITSAPRRAAALACSARRRAITASRLSFGSAVPLSPSVIRHSVMTWPSAAHLRRVPPAMVSASSGWAKSVRIRLLMALYYKPRRGLPIPLDLDSPDVRSAGETMARLTVLVVDRQEIRRKELARGLASYAYEVVTAADGDEGQRFAEGLSPDAVVIEAALAGPVMAAVAGEAGPLRILLDDGVEAPDAGPGPVVAVAGLAPEAIVRKVRTALLGRELGIPADARLEALEGNLLALPLLELLPNLRRLVVSGRVLLADGEVALEEGEAVAARAGAVRGAKAFARLARTTFGSFRVLVGPAAVPREIAEDMLSSAISRGTAAGPTSTRKLPNVVRASLANALAPRTAPARAATASPSSSATSPSARSTRPLTTRRRRFGNNSSNGSASRFPSRASSRASAGVAR